MSNDENAANSRTRRSAVAHNRLERRIARGLRDRLIATRREVREAESFDRGLSDRLDPGPEPVLGAAIDWLLAAQRESASNDGGVARHYALGRGWGRSYPETTGYIVATLLDPEVGARRPATLSAAKRAIDWLLEIQTPAGGWPGSVAGASTDPVTFNTGQIMIGLAEGLRAIGADTELSLRRAGAWLLEMQDVDGAWRRGHSSFAAPGPSVYELHTTWGLLEAADVLVEPSFRVAAVKQADWALGEQHENGWFARCDLTDDQRPLTHTIAYAVRGLLETWRHAGTERHLEAAIRASRAVDSVLTADGYLPGRLDAHWGAAANWSCLTGTSQMALCWGMLFQETGDREFLDAMCRANSFVRRAVRLDGPLQVVGGVPGAHPLSGDYGRYELLNWATKFTIDAQLLELKIARDGGLGRGGNASP